MTKLINSSKKKFALLIGINYIGTSSQLSGCINDCINTKKFLLEKCGFKESEILMIVDDGTTTQKPTKKNIENGLNLLVQKALAGCEFLWFSYSGHGSHQRDTNGDETDGSDELLCPVDYNTSGFIVDDYIYNNLVSKLPQSTTLVSIMDCCHSGTIFDLPYTYDTKLSDANKNKPKATVISISGCKDDQTSADAFIDRKSQGAMTWSLLTALQNSNYSIKIEDLIKQMRTLLAKEYTQYPLLGMSSTSLLDSWFMNPNLPRNNQDINPNTNQDINTNQNTNQNINLSITIDNNFKQINWNIISVTTGKSVYANYQILSKPKEKISRDIQLSPDKYKIVLTNSGTTGIVVFSIKNGGQNIITKKVFATRLSEYTFQVSN